MHALRHQAIFKYCKHNLLAIFDHAARDVWNIRRKMAIKQFRRIVLPKPGPASQFRLEYTPDSQLQRLPDQHIRVKVASCAIAYRDIIDRTGENYSPFS